MSFISYTFLFWFLPLVVGIHALLKGRARTGFLLLASYVFYGFWRVDYLALVFFSTVLDFAVAQRIAVTQAPGKRKGWLAFSVVVNIGLLAYFKYMGFWARELEHFLGVDLGFTVKNLILPMGISFYTFQTLSYTIDVYRKDVAPCRSLIDYACYVSLFPQMMAGPIVRYKTIAHDLVSGRTTWEGAYRGLTRFMLGFAKKVWLADTIAQVADHVFGLPVHGFVDSWAGSVAFGLQLYFDFSAYSDMAIGLGWMLGFNFPENFNHPYRARSFRAFWGRWHITLSQWFRDYVYIPLGGNRGPAIRVVLNLFLTMALAGLWHGADSWNYVIWGLYFAVLVTLERTWSGKLPGMVMRPLAVMAFLVSMVLFRTQDLNQAMDFFSAMLGLESFYLTGLHLTVSPLGLCAMVFGLLWVFRPQNLEAPWTSKPVAIFAMVIFALAVLQMLTRAQQPFLYFQF